MTPPNDRRRSFAEGLTILELLGLALERASTERAQAGPGDEGREFSLACTAIEDASMRVNRGFAVRAGAKASNDYELGIRQGGL